MLLFKNLQVVFLIEARKFVYLVVETNKRDPEAWTEVKRRKPSSTKSVDTKVSGVWNINIQLLFESVKV